MVSLERGPSRLFIELVSIFFLCIKNSYLPDILKPRHILYRNRLTLYQKAFVYRAGSVCECAVQAKYLSEKELKQGL